MSRRLRLQITCALKERRIEGLQVWFHVCYVQVSPPCYHFLHNRRHLPALSQSIFDFVGGSEFFSEGAVEEQGLKWPTQNPTRSP